jgi:hypothetical protein
VLCACAGIQKLPALSTGWPLAAVACYPPGAEGARAAVLGSDELKEHLWTCLDWILSEVKRGSSDEVRPPPCPSTSYIIRHRTSCGFVEGGPLCCFSPQLSLRLGLEAHHQPVWMGSAR